MLRRFGRRQVGSSLPNPPRNPRSLAHDRRVAKHDVRWWGEGIRWTLAVARQRRGEKTEGKLKVGRLQRRFTVRALRLTWCASSILFERPVASVTILALGAHSSDSRAIDRSCGTPGALGGPVETRQRPRRAHNTRASDCHRNESCRPIPTLLRPSSSVSIPPDARRRVARGKRVG